MACMCGDICCPSCGPAQGNTRCVICSAWASEGCPHRDENGTILPEFELEAEDCQDIEREAEDATYEEVGYWEPLVEDENGDDRS